MYGGDACLVLILDGNVANCDWDHRGRILRPRYHRRHHENILDVDDVRRRL